MYPNSNSGGYTYTNAGFNRFLRRTIASDPNSATLTQMKRSTVGANNLNFDQMQVSGNMGDVFEVGSMLFDGSTGTGRIDGRDRDNGNATVWRVGDLEAA